MEAFSLSYIINSLTTLQESQHQALLDLCNKHQLCFKAFVQESQWVHQKLLQSTTSPAVYPATDPHLTLTKIASTDDQEVVLGVFQAYSSCIGMSGVGIGSPNPPLAISDSPACYTGAAVMDTIGISSHQWVDQRTEDLCMPT